MDKQAHLSPEKQRLLALRLKGTNKEEATANRIRKRTTGRQTPLSTAQHQMWIVDRLAPGNPAYNVPVAYRLRGELNIQILEQSFNMIIERHEIWRTTFREVEGHAVQEVHSDFRIQIGLTDLSQLPVEQREQKANILASQESGKPFDLYKLPLVRVSLFQLDKNDHILLINFHHIVVDGLSLNLMFDELDAIYRATVSGTAPRLPELMVQYADFAAWQAEDSRSNHHSEQLDYWLRQLRGDLPVLEFAADKPRPFRQSYNGSSVNFTIPKALAQSLASIRSQTGSTFFVTILAAFQVVLMRYAHAEEILIGTPIANRPLNELDRLIGNFINIVALRCEISGNPTFVELLQRSRELTLDALSNKDIPFETIVKNLGSHRDPGRNPVFQTLLQILPPVRAKIGELTVSTFDFVLPFAQMDLVLSLYEETDGSFLGKFQYSTDLFDSQTIERLSLNFVHLLNDIVKNPLRKISEVSILSEAEANLILREWNQTACEYPSNTTIQVLVEGQASRTPDSIALEFEDQRLTYRELNRRSNQLAGRLLAMGVRPNALVGICAENPAVMIIGLLGTLKAGGAYVPMDSAYPKDRLSYMLEDAAVPVLLTEQHLVAGLPSHQAKIICIDNEWGVTTAVHDIAPEVNASPDDLAYVIYTSGSTGRPKGVEIAQRGLCNMIDWQTRAFQVNEKSRVLQFASFSFDASVSEVFMALTKGATLVLKSRKAGMSSIELAAFLRRNGITHATFPPSLLAVLSAENLPALTTVISAGEACSAEIARRWSQGRRFFNAYGPTEATVCVSSYLCGNESKPPTIGRPIQNTQLYILDRHLNPLPVGVPGELHIGGIDLARGYLNRPDLTNETFIPNPFDAQARLYKTGDLCRFLPDGNIEYLGRMDSQVKIRGFRIELGEIVSLLREDPAVSDAAVVARKEKSGDKRLIAYVVRAETTQPSVSSLRDHLKARVPDYMVPAEFVFIDKIPLSTNGKVDHRALPEPSGLTEPAREYAPPQNAVQTKLVEIWEDLLKRRPIGIHDNFFDLGGHSLAAMQVVSRLRQSMHAELPLARFFESPTIAAIALAITEESSNEISMQAEREEGVL